jgi:tetratricopeptide (TPR) repeat protein
MIREHPLLGSGPASFSLNYPYLSNGDPAGAVHSHNVLLEIALESGVAGLIAAALAGAGALAILTRLWRHGTGHDRLVAAAVAGALASFVVNGMADALHLFPEILFALGALMAIAVRSGADLGDELSLRPWYYRLGLNRALPLAPFALAAAMLLVWSRIDLAAGYYSRSISFASQHDWVASALEANRAHTTDPGLAIYPVQEALSLEMAQENGQDNTGRQRAIDLLNRALAVEPRSSITRLDLAPLLEADGQHLAAVDQTTLMVAGAPRDSLVLLAAGVMEEGAHPEQAIADYASAMAESPRIADSPFWQTTAFRRRNFKVIVQQALSKAEGEDSSSGPDAVRQIVSEAAGVDVPSAGQGGALVAKVDLARRLIRGGRSDEAATILAPVGRAHPDDPSIRLALGELDEARGDLRAARGEWLAGAYLGDVESIMHLGDTSPSGRVPARIRELGHWGLADLWDRQFSLAVQHYRFAYRRQEPLPIVLPGDWLNALPALYSRLQSAVDRWDAGETAQPGRQ